VGERKGAGKGEGAGKKEVERAGKVEGR